MRASTLALLALAACQTADAPTDAPVRLSETAAPAPDAAPSRAEAAGLSEAQAAEMERLGVPVYVPDLPAGWTLSSASVTAGEWPAYTLVYETPAGACLTLDAASEGLGGVFAQEPPNVRDADVPGVPMDGPARLGWSEPGDTAEGWSGGRVATDLFGTDGLALHLDSDLDGGCRLATPADAQALLAALRPLDPADDVLQIGLVAAVDEVYQSETDLPTGPDPEAVALAFAGPEDAGEGNQRTAVETLRRRERVAVVLVTTTDVADDSVRDVRTRVVLRREGAAWEIASAGEQTRCQPGRGYAEWSAGVCV